MTSPPPPLPMGEGKCVFINSLFLPVPLCGTPMWMRCEGATPRERNASALGAHLCWKGCARQCETQYIASPHVGPGNSRAQQEGRKSDPIGCPHQIIIFFYY
jgi:hypothetical protein